MIYNNHSFILIWKLEIYATVIEAHELYGYLFIGQTSTMPCGHSLLADKTTLSHGDKNKFNRWLFLSLLSNHICILTLHGAFEQPFHLVPQKYRT